MKFAEHLGAHITPEWRKQYIQYEEMKAMLYAALEEAPAADGAEPQELTAFFANFDEKFFTFCEKELTKINTFYAEKLAEATRKYAALTAELSAASELRTQNKRERYLGLFRNTNDDDKEKRKEVTFSSSNNNNNKISWRKMQDLKLAFSEYYLSLVLLQNYQNLNFTGFRKILKKHDKNLSTDSGLKWRHEHVDVSHFYTNKDIDKLIGRTENSFIEHLEAGDRQKAMKRLRVPPLGDHHSPWTTFKVGLFAGAFVVLIIVVLLSSIFHDHENEERSHDWRIALRLYRGAFLTILFISLIGVNVYGWRSSGVNHVLIFELDPRNHLSEQHLMELAAILGVVWSLSVLTFLYSSQLALPAYANPLTLALTLALFLLNPTRTFRHEARFWLLRLSGRILAAPFFYVGFADFWLADQLNSLATVALDMHFLVCFYTTKETTMDDQWHVASHVADEVCVEHNLLRPFIACLPAWFRFAQCLRRYRDTREAFPHLVNAGKYSTTFFVILFANVYKRTHGSGLVWLLWISAQLVNSVYCYAWDIEMDWGLMDHRNSLLREEIVYGSKVYYYLAMTEDFLLRFSWPLQMALLSSNSVDSELLITVVACLEVFRRFVWNFFRLENEHLNNCGKFRAVRDISVAPIDASDQADMIRMMDDSNEHDENHDGGVGDKRRRMRFRANRLKAFNINNDSNREELEPIVDVDDDE